MNRAFEYGIRATWISGERSTVREVVRTLVLGVGNPFFPRSRNSIGIYALDRLAESLGFESSEWEERKNVGGWVLENDSFVLAKPLTHLPGESHEALKALAGTLGSGPEHTVALCYDPTVPLGQIVATRGDTRNFEEQRLGTEGMGGKQKYLREVKEQLDPVHDILTSSDWFVYGIGINSMEAVSRTSLRNEHVVAGGFSRPASLSTSRLRLLNRFQDDEMPLVDSVCQSALESVLTEAKNRQLEND